MSTHIVNLSWERTTKDFNYKTFNRAHTVLFSGGESVEISAAPDYFGNPNLVNPEELFVAALSSCFMLTFLAYTANKGLIVDSYVDQAHGVLSKNPEGKMCITEVTLHPQIVFTEANKPDADNLHQLLEKAHQNCFIANSVKTIINVKPEIPAIEQI